MSSIIKNRFIIFGIFIIVFMAINYTFTKSVLPSTDTKDLWFYSGLAMTIFSILFIEPYYSSPKNVITNAIPLFLVFMSIKNSFENQTFWWIGIIIILSLLVFSIMVMFLEDKNKSNDDWHNLWAERIKKYVVFLGQGKFLYSSVFIVVLLTYYSIKDLYTLTLFAMWFIIVSINPKNLTNTFSTGKRKYSKEALGTIFGVESNGIFLTKIFDDKNNINKFDTVEFIYSFENNQLTSKGLIFDTYSLNSEKWAKVLELKKEYIESNVKILDTNIIYKTSNIDDLRLDDFVGIVVENSSIGKVKFEYSKQNDNLEEGDLVEIKINEKTIYYQVLEGFTSSEVLESKNKSGFIRGEALQLGEWDNENLNFKKFGWVPKINTPIFTANTATIEIKTFVYPEYQLGVIPNTHLPSVINLHDAVSHHMALIGVTGSGKSFLAREIIKELQKDTKIICVDFTGEYIKELASLNPVHLIKKDRLPEVEEEIAKKETEASQRGGGNKSTILQYKKNIQTKLDEHIDTFIKSDNKISLFELPELSNTAFILEFTQMFLEGVFNYAKKNKGQKICIVLEEAHTIIPETNFLGDLGDYGSTKALVSKMSQIALQGRKYGVGLMVLAQRTANVSKTVLTQCNTIISFQAFDETSFTFLSNYIGKDLAQALPHLKQHHAVVTGKAVKSNLPMIIDLTRK
ncbi:ATP-binding protein [Aliarcobacter skirrowii]|uniref:ATP-binding protein n=1 Tax=Aliarcobacter skirrowii TaxID=28200 RepID=UPI0029BF4EC8|nr:ATP-binding protein [Aliarcobacter skirrowii]MDX4012940.1 ATP-binding protein [Aliarcobacter skirrowii]